MKGTGEEGGHEGRVCLNTLLTSPQCSEGWWRTGLKGNQKWKGKLGKGVAKRLTDIKKKKKKIGNEKDIIYAGIMTVKAKRKKSIYCMLYANQRYWR